MIGVRLTIRQDHFALKPIDGQRDDRAALAELIARTGQAAD